MKLNESIYSMYQRWTSGNIRKEDIHPYVDLGLPSGTLWATCNIGAEEPYEEGDYLAWGELEPKDTYDEVNYKFKDDYVGRTKYTGIDKLSELEPKDDVAHVKWGNGWRIPSRDDFEELLTNCDYKAGHYPDTNINCGIFTSKINKNKLYIKFGGFKWDKFTNNESIKFYIFGNRFYYDEFVSLCLVGGLENVSIIDKRNENRDGPFQKYGYNIRPVKYKKQI